MTAMIADTGAAADSLGGCSTERNELGGLRARQGVGADSLDLNSAFHTGRALNMADLVITAGSSSC